MAEIVDVCVSENVDPDLVSCQVPSRIMEDAIFVIDLKKVDVRDLTTDDNGIYGRHSSPTQKIVIHFDNNKVSSFETQVSSEKKGCGQEFQVRRLYSWHQVSGLKRTVIKVTHGDDLMPYAILQYKAVNIETNSIRSHGNSKIHEPYIRTKPSVLGKIRQLSDEQPKAIVRKVTLASGGTFLAKSASDIPRDRRQVYNIISREPARLKSRNTGPNKTPQYGKLLTSMSSGSFLQDVSFSVKGAGDNVKTFPNTFATTSNHLHWLQTFCNGQMPAAQVGIDMTYGVGPYYCTALTFPHPMFVHKANRQTHPTIFLGMMTSISRETTDYEYLAANLKKRNIKSLTYGTDGELALERGFENVYPIKDVATNQKSIHLRCFEHVKVDLKMKMEKLNIPAIKQSKIMTDILGSEYEGNRVSGLVDSQDEEEFERNLCAFQKTIPDELKIWMTSGKGRIRPLTETIKKCMLRPVRTAAGLGDPPNKYDNQRAEAFNTILKDATKRTNVDQVTIHELVDEKIVKDQKDELVKAIFGMGQYRLSSLYSHLSVPSHQWFQMTPEQREGYIEKVFKSPNTLKRPYSTHIRDIPNITKTNLQEIWRKAAVITDDETIISLANGTLCVTDGNDSFIVRNASKSSSYHCECPVFKANSVLCHHLVAVLEKDGSLEKYLDKLEHQHEKPFQAMFNKLPDSGKKPGAKKRRGNNNVEKHPIIKLHKSSDSIISPRPSVFHEYYHNDELFKIVFIKDHKKATKCESCGNAIPKSFLTQPHDIVIVHSERYAYPKTDDNGQIKMVITRKRMAARFYCVKKSCVLKRHPYFWIGRIAIDDDVNARLQQRHLTLLEETLDGYKP